VVAQHLSVLAAVRSHIEHAIDAEISKQTAQLHPLVDQMKLLAGYDKITSQPLEHPAEAVPQSRRNGVGPGPHESARLPLGAGESKYSKTADDLGDELASTNFARARSSILE